METLNLELSLGPPLPPLPPPSQPPPPPSSTTPQPPPPEEDGAEVSEPKRKRRRTKQNNESIEPPYPWSTGHRARIHELKYLISNGIRTITGEVKCNKCGKEYTMEFDLMEKFNKIMSFIGVNWDRFHDRAPKCWANSNLLNCRMCKQEKCVEPIIPPEEEDQDHEENNNNNNENNSKINWLFLFLGQMLGRLKLKQLKYFCTHTNSHRTGAKNRLIYLTYITLCKQLQPSNKLFDN